MTFSARVQIPAEASVRFPELFRSLDEGKDALEVENYGLSQCTLEEIFLKIASNEDLAEGEAVDIPPSTAALDGLAEQSIAEQSEGVVIFRHYTALVTKRANYGRRDIKSLACVTLLPVLLLVAGLSLLKYAGSPTQPSLLMSTAQFTEVTPVPYNASVEAPDGKRILTKLGSGDRVVLQPKALENCNTCVNVTGQLFGVEYVDGVPCHYECPSLDGPTCAVIGPALPALTQTGFGITCDSTELSCKASIASACANNAAGCVTSCMKAAGQQGNRQLCQQTYV